MGQKVNPTGFRLGTLRYWESIWYAGRNQYHKQLVEDFRIREYLLKKLENAAVSKVEIKRVLDDKVTVNIHSARPGLIIGRKGAEIDRLSSDLTAKFGKKAEVKIVEIKKADLDSNLVAQKIASQFLRRIAFRRVMKSAVYKTLRDGALGIKIQVSGRLAGAEMARVEWVREGRVPLQTIRADIDYGFAEGRTKYGIIGIKVWIYKGDKLDYEKFAF